MRNTLERRVYNVPTPFSARVDFARPRITTMAGKPGVGQSVYSMWCRQVVLAHVPTVESSFLLHESLWYECNSFSVVVLVSVRELR